MNKIDIKNEAGYYQQPALMAICLGLVAIIVAFIIGWHNFYDISPLIKTSSGARFQRVYTYRNASSKIEEIKDTITGNNYLVCKSSLFSTPTVTKESISSLGVQNEKVTPSFVDAADRFQRVYLQHNDDANIGVVEDLVTGNAYLTFDNGIFAGLWNNNPLIVRENGSAPITQYEKAAIDSCVSDDSTS